MYSESDLSLLRTSPYEVWMIVCPSEHEGVQPQFRSHNTTGFQNSIGSPYEWEQTGSQARTPPLPDPSYWAIMTPDRIINIWLGRENR